MLYDLFICHASEDKESFVRPLAKELRKQHVEVWFDEFSLVVGDSLRESIDKGLAQSRFGAVVLSPAFFQKRWTGRELNGLVAREMAGDETVILPVWHGVSHENVVRYSPPLADVRAIDSKKGVRYVVRELLRRVRPQQSPLVVARKELIDWGLLPPVVTDEWWLQVVIDSSRLDGWGMGIPEQSVWGRWAFPLPEGDGPDAMGLRLAWTALQRKWIEVADTRRITQITRPDEVLSFIASQPGLTETCHDFPHFLATYAPQLTIPGFGGPFEPDFELFSKKDPDADELQLRRAAGERGDPSLVACQFVQGDIGGPRPSYYEHFDYLVWFLSNDSAWLPADIRELLQEGMKQWGVWPRADVMARDWERPFLKALWYAREKKTKFRMTPEVEADLRDFVDRALRNLELNEQTGEVLTRFLAMGYIEYFVKNVGEQQRKKRRSQR